MIEVRGSLLEEIRSRLSGRAAQRRVSRVALALFTPAAAGWLAGCDAPHQKPSERLAISGIGRVAVAPVMNFSGEPSLDPIRAADLLAAELGEVDGCTVVPVNRVVAALSRRGTPFVQSPEHAADICRTVGADAILVPAITEYDPYPPMTVGLVMELYVPGAGSTPQAGRAPISQTQLVLKAAHDETVRRVKRYASSRSASAGPFAWRRYLVAQEQYLQFCFHSGLESMLKPDSYRMALGETSDE